jgi:hypothetical protein
MVLGHLHYLAGYLPLAPPRAAPRLAGATPRRRSPGGGHLLGRSIRSLRRSRDVNFATRPITRTLVLAIPEGAYGIIFTSYSDVWRPTCRICNIGLLSS